MKSEDLFLAIGGVESSRLERTELSLRQSSAKQKEETTMYQSKRTRIVHNTLVAVLIAATLATAAFAAVGYTLFDNPKDMLDTLFGNKTYDSATWTVPNYKGDVAAQYHSERVSVDETISGSLADQAEPVGKSITWAGHTLTVDANLYDPTTQSGFLTYTIENPNGIRTYAVAPNGEIGFPNGELLKSNQYGRSYVIQDKCTDTKLCATYYYRIVNPQTTNLELGFTFWAKVDHPEALSNEDLEKLDASDSPEIITVPCNGSARIPSQTFGNGSVTLSSFAIQIRSAKLEQGDGIGEVKMTFRDGSEYVVEDDSTINYLYNVLSPDWKNVTMMLNRLVDVEEVVSVTVDGQVLTK